MCSPISGSNTSFYKVSLPTLSVFCSWMSNSWKCWDFWHRSNKYTTCGSLEATRVNGYFKREMLNGFSFLCKNNHILEVFSWLYFQVKWSYSTEGWGRQKCCWKCIVIIISDEKSTKKILKNTDLSKSTTNVLITHWS